MQKKSIHIITFLSIAVLLGGLYKRFIGSGIRADVFLFYNYPNGGRLVTNIINDVSQMFTVSLILFLWVYHDSRKSIEKAVTPFFIISVIDMIDYFVFYKQMSLYKLPLLIFLLIIFNKPCKSKK